MGNAINTHVVPTTLKYPSDNTTKVIMEMVDIEAWVLYMLMFDHHK